MADLGNASVDLEGMIHENECPGCGFPGEPVSYTFTRNSEPRARCDNEFTKCNVDTFKIGVVRKAKPSNLHKRDYRGVTISGCVFCGKPLVEVDGQWVHAHTHSDRCDGK